MKEILSSVIPSNVAHIFFKEAYAEEVIRDLNKNSSPGPDKITPELIQNGGKTLITCIAILLQDCYLLGYFPKCWKQDNRIYIKKKTDKDNYHIPNYTGSSHFSILWLKSMEKCLLEAVNFFTESKFLMEKMSIHIKK